MKSPNRSINAFTLIELIVSIAIATSLMIAILGMVSRLSEQRKKIEEAYPQRSWLNNLKQALEADYQNCQSFLIAPDKFAMITSHSTFSSLQSSPATGSSQMPAAVVYQVKTIGNENFLLRLQKSLVEGESKETYRSLAANGIRRIDIEQKVETDIPLPMITLRLTSTQGEVFRLCLVRHGGLE